MESAVDVSSFHGKKVSILARFVYIALFFSPLASTAAQKSMKLFFEVCKAIVEYRWGIGLVTFSVSNAAVN